MKKMLIIVFSIVLISVAEAQLNEGKIPEELSDAEAKHLAIAANKKITVLKNRLNIMMRKKNTDDYAQWHRELTHALKQWPADHLKNRAMFPYYECRSAMSEMLTYGMLWQQGRSASAGSTAKKNFKISEAECAASIKNPDLSLKDIQ